MSEYNQFVTAVNKIFEDLAKMKAGWNSIDNLNYIESIEEYKKVVSASTEIFKNSPNIKKQQESLEELGND